MGSVFDRTQQLQMLSVDAKGHGHCCGHKSVMCGSRAFSLRMIPTCCGYDNLETPARAQLYFAIPVAPPTTAFLAFTIDLLCKCLQRIAYFGRRDAYPRTKFFTLLHNMINNNYFVHIIIDYNAVWCFCTYNSTSLNYCYYGSVDARQR